MLDSIHYYNARHDCAVTVTYYDYWCERLLSCAPIPVDGLALELMAGGIELARRGASAFPSWLVTDLDEALLRRGFQELNTNGQSHVTAICANAAALPVASESLSAVFVQGGLHHVRPHLSEVLAEIGRVLRPNGILIASEPANDNLLIRAFRRCWYAIHPLQGNDPDEDGFTEDGLRILLAAANLELRSYTRFGFLAYPLLGNTDLVPLFRRSKSTSFAKTLIKFDEFLEAVPGIKSFAWGSIFTAVKSPC